MLCTIAHWSAGPVGIEMEGGLANYSEKAASYGVLLGRPFRQGDLPVAAYASYWSHVATNHCNSRGAPQDDLIGGY